MFILFYWAYLITDDILKCLQLIRSFEIVWKPIHLVIYAILVLFYRQLYTGEQNRLNLTKSTRWR